jgi:hypothetical protein
MARRIIWALLFSLLELTQIAEGASSVTIISENGYKQLRQCAQFCVWHAGAVDDLMAEGLGCTSPWVNDCLCRLDLAPIASSFVSKCCSSRCTIGSADGDVSSAIGVYNTYCQANGFAVAGAGAAVASTTGFDAGQTETRKTGMSWLVSGGGDQMADIANTRHSTSCRPTNTNRIDEHTEQYGREDSLGLGRGWPQYTSVDWYYCIGRVLYSRPPVWCWV